MFVARTNVFGSTALAPEDPSFYGNRAAAYLMLNRFQDSLADCQAAIRLDPGFTKAYFRAARSYIALGQLERAEQQLAEVIRLEPNNRSVGPQQQRIRDLGILVGAARQQLDAGNFDNAIQLAQRMFQLAEFDGFLPAVLTQVRALLEMRQVERARELINAAYETHKQDVEVILLRGRVLLASGNNANAEKHFQTALRLAPDNRDAMYLFKGVRKALRAKDEGNEAFKAGRNQEALQLYSEALEFPEMSAEFVSVIRCNRAAVSLRTQDWKAVISDCSEALKINPDYSRLPRYCLPSLALPNRTRVASPQTPPALLHSLNPPVRSPNPSQGFAASRPGLHANGTI